MKNMASQVTMLLRSKSYTRCSSSNCMCTKAVILETDKKKEKGETLYRRLSAFRETDGNITDTLDNWVKQGNYVKRFDIVGYVNLLRKFKKYQQANQVLQYFPLQHSNICMYVCM